MAETIERIQKQMNRLAADVTDEKQENQRPLLKSLPEIGYLRLPQIIGDPKAEPPIPALIPVSRSTFLAGVKSGKYPKSCKLSTRCTAWRVSDIRDFIDGADSK